jgi:hypothetical protein
MNSLSSKEIERTMSFDDLDHHGRRRRYVASLDQLGRLFSYPTNPDHPVSNAGDTAPEPIDDTELGAEVAELEANLRR